MTRDSKYDSEPSRYMQYIKSPVRFYDSNFNLIHEQVFNGYPKKIEYYNGTYYCLVYGEDGSQSLSSTDMVNWQESEIYIYDLPYQVGANIRKYDKNVGAFISIAGNDFKKVVKENTEMSYTNSCRCGDLYVSISDEEIMLTKDYFYYAKVDMPIDLTLENADLSINCAYEYGDEFIIDTKTYRFRIPKQPIYNELEQLSGAPYVCVNNTILEFETPPVTESDRTLVPMRFLFEQLGADVTWDEATETATAVKANTTINFSIDNTTATVNGAETVMDVPARLVGDKTMVPLRFLSEEMGYTVEWDEETRMATITTPLVSRMAEAEDTDVFGEWLR